MPKWDFVDDQTLETVFPDGFLGARDIELRRRAGDLADDVITPPGKGSRWIG